MGNTIRRVKDNRFTTICNDIYNDTRLDMKARGIHTYILTKSDTWKVVVEDLIHSGLDGERAIRSGINLLVKYHYWQRYRVYDSKNRILCGETTVYETPYTEDEKIIRAKLSADGKTMTYYYENGTEQTIENDANVIQRYKEKVLDRSKRIDYNYNRTDTAKTDKQEPTGRKKTPAIAQAESEVKQQVGYDDYIEEMNNDASVDMDSEGTNKFISFINQSISAAASMRTEDETIIKGLAYSKDTLTPLVKLLTMGLIIEFWEDMRPKLLKLRAKNIHGYIKSSLYFFLKDYQMNELCIIDPDIPDIQDDS